jgi:hypothetical protein
VSFLPLESIAASNHHVGDRQISETQSASQEIAVKGDSEKEAATEP